MNIREQITQLVNAITPYDKQEKEHIADVLSWIQSEADLFRIKKPDVPPKHLVSYIVLIDTAKKQVLLVHHKKAKLLLPPGGHVEINEHPTETVKRELQEELQLSANFITKEPFFITVTKTINNDAGHTDVSLWYLLQGDTTQQILYDKREMSGYQWSSYNQIIKLHPKETDTHMHRFIKKLQKASLL
jgi:8-oxo-dGTP diphosphatase